MKDINSFQSGMVQENDVNNPSVQTYKGKNQFPQSFQHPSTCQYGYIDPVAVAKCEVGDVFPYKFVTDLNTFTMKSPLKSQVKMYSAAFKVPMEAIYPRTYKFLFSFAQKGDEVPQDQATPQGINNSERAIFPARKFTEQIFQALTRVVDGKIESQYILDSYIKLILLLESVYSDGSIFAKMNMHLCSTQFVISNADGSDSGSFDYLFDSEIYPKLLEIVDYYGGSADRGWLYLSHRDGGTYESGYPVYILTDDPTKFNTRFNDPNGIFDSVAYFCSLDRALELMRTGDWSINTPNFEFSQDLIESKFFEFSYPLGRTPNIPVALNIEPIIAYQLSCAHFFNNPKIDFIYTAQLWRDNLQSIFTHVFELPSFDYNGTVILSDVVSYSYMKQAASGLTDTSDLDTFHTCLDYFFHLFSFQRSLRYGDYFTGSRPEPIGVGDISLEENSLGNIDSLEVARKLQLTRLLHKVAITGPDHSQQIKYIFGGNLPDVPTDVPIRLSLEEFDVQGFETNNTGDAQLSSDSPNITTTNLRLSDSKFMFEVEVNEPCWLVMVQYFEAHRIYANTIDRFAYHYDLYDDFVPDMQFVGDQDVKQSELLGVYGDQFTPFAYHLRNMEYKQRVSYASGGFLRMLPSWAFITDNNDGNPAYSNITPEYIRSSPSEFDRFYKSLTGHSLGSRFHFITMNTNVMAPYRQMVYSPEILA